ncbi:MAG: pilin [Patescibacteria group bacterium]
MIAEIISRILPTALAADIAPVTLIPQEGDLASKFISGDFEIYDLGKYVIYLIEFLIYIGGGIAVLFVVIGGYKYIVGGSSDSKDAGKKTIGYALAGFAVTVLAWVIVNFVQVWLTSGGAESKKLDEAQKYCEAQKVEVNAIQAECASASRSGLDACNKIPNEQEADNCVGGLIKQTLDCTESKRNPQNSGFMDVVMSKKDCMDENYVLKCSEEELKANLKAKSDEAKAKCAEDYMK